MNIRHLFFMYLILLCDREQWRYSVLVDDILEEWFCREILVHEAALMSFLTRRAGVTLAEDLRHDVYIRILEFAEAQRPSAPKAFLFTTARNLLVDRARRDRIVAIDLVEDLDVLNVLVDAASPERQVSGRQQLQRLSRILERMPEKCRKVFWMRRVDGVPQREVATSLGLTEAAVEKYVHRGLRLLSNALYGEASNQDANDERKNDAESKDGE